jgi:hypothetical protein
MKTGAADMFLYSENFAGKGPNESISCLDFYIKNRKSNFRNFFIFSDDCLAQNKNRYIWIYYWSLIKNNMIDEITIMNLIPGHSYLDCDRDFGEIEKIRLTEEKVGFPSQWVNLIRKTYAKFNIN